MKNRYARPPQKTAVVFHGRQKSEAIPTQEASPDRFCCLLSLRNQKYLLPDMKLQYVPMKDYAEVVRKPWQSSMTLNVENGQMWLKENSQLFTELFFLGFTGVHELWFCKSGVISKSLEAQAQRHLIPLHKVYSQSGTPTSRQPLHIFCLRSDSELLSCLWPNLVYEFYNSICIGVDAPEEFYPSSHSTEIDTIFAAMKSTTIENFHTVCMNAPINWKYMIKMDMSFYDVGDPLYCLISDKEEQWKKHLTMILSQNCYETHRLPMLDSLIWNWAGFGDIPVLAT